MFVIEKLILLTLLLTLSTAEIMLVIELRRSRKAIVTMRGDLRAVAGLVAALTTLIAALQLGRGLRKSRE